MSGVSPPTPPTNFFEKKLDQKTLDKRRISNTKERKGKIYGASPQTPQAFYKKLDQKFLNNKANMVML